MVRCFIETDTPIVKRHKEDMRKIFMTNKLEKTFFDLKKFHRYTIDRQKSRTYAQIYFVHRSKKYQNQTAELYSRRMILASGCVASWAKESVNHAGLS